MSLRKQFEKSTGITMRDNPPESYELEYLRLFASWVETRHNVLRAALAVLLIALFLVVFCSCEMRFLGSGFDALFHDGSYHFSFPQEFKDQMDIATFVASNVDYSTDLELHGISEYWQTPEETLASGRGDCEDSVILFLALTESAFGKRGDLIGVIGPSGPHAVALIDGRVYDLTNKFSADISEYPFQQVIGIYIYEQAMIRAYTTH